MSWSNLAGDRSPDPVVLCFFGHIDPPMRTRNHASLFEGFPKTKLQGSDAKDTKTLQSQTNITT
jgi:hypothetical protein